MKARKNPTDEQRMRRLRRAPISCHDPRIKNDAFWALRDQGYSTSYAKRAFRDTPPEVRIHAVGEANDGYADGADELFFKPGDTWQETVVEIRPELSEQSIAELQPRSSEYGVWDIEIPGFGVRVRVSGYKSYVFCYHVRGQKKVRRITIGNVIGISLAAARELARDYRLEVRRGNDPAMKLKKRTDKS